jgi:plastocyanin
MPWRTRSSWPPEPLSPSPRAPVTLGLRPRALPPSFGTGHRGRLPQGQPAGSESLLARMERQGGAGALVTVALVCIVSVWHTSSREQSSRLQEERHRSLQHVEQEGDITVRMIPGLCRHLGWLIVLLTVLILGVGDAAAEPKKFTFINVVLDGTKIWLPSSVMVQEGDEVELTLINKLDDPHGFKIADWGIEEVIQPTAQMTIKFTASQPGVHSYLCHLHPPHLGGQILVLGE